MGTTMRILAVAVLAAALFGCGIAEKMRREAEAKQEERTAPRVVHIPVEVERPRRGPISEYLDTISKIEAEARVDVTSEGVGKCVEVKVEEGDMVKKGDVLAELDKNEAAAAFAQARVQKEQRAAEYKRARQGAKEDDGIAITSQADLDASRYALEQAEANLAAQQAQYDNLTIKAPIDGVITLKNIQVGQLVSSGTPVFSIVDPSTYMCVIYPTERELPRLHKGQRARVEIDALPGEVFDAVVRRINPGVDATTGTIKVTLDFDEETRKRLREGVFARVKLVMATREDALLVPKGAVVEENTRKYVFLVTEASAEEAEAMGEDHTDDEPCLVAQRVEVETGLENSTSVEIVSGVEDDALMVTLGYGQLKSGSPVRITNAAEELAKTADMTPEEALAEAEARRAAGAKNVYRFDGHGGRRF